MKMEQKECSETLAYKIQMPGNYPEESIQQQRQGLCFLTLNISLLTATTILIPFLCCYISSATMVESEQQRFYIRM